MSTSKERREKNAHWLSGRLYDQRVRKSSKCFGKHSYRRQDAERAVAHYINRVALMFGKYNCYYCPVHQAWHVGHRGKRDSLVSTFDRWILGN